MFYFFLGNTPELSLLELQTLYPGTFELKSKDIASFSGEIELSDLSRLGGVRKVAELLDFSEVKSLESKLAELISSDDGGKNVAVTSYLQQDSLSLNLSAIKKSVAQTRPIRFVSMDVSEHELLMLSHQHVIEFNLIPSGKDVIIAKTVWIYDAKDWVSRDRNKPYRDIKRGMLPPKVARIMVNLAACGREGITLADPFCGTGTILTEAVMVGCNVVGSDTNPDAIPGSKSNLEWLLSTPELVRRDYQLIIGDCTHFDEFAPTVDCIATEPYMGPLLDERNPLSLEKIKNIAKGLGKLYLGAFKSFHKVLPVGGRVVMSIPVFAVYGRLLETISIDSLVALGYNYLQSVAYSKPGAAVIRNITILEKK